MKCNLTTFGIVLLFLFMLLSPTAVFNGASDGLLLWFHTIVPTLFPFIFITDFMIYTNTIQSISKLFSPFIQRFFKTSKAGSFAVVTGFLCGYPLGAKVTANLLQEKAISIQESKYLLSFCNNASPIFILNFIVWKTLNHQDLTIPTLLLILGVPACLSFLFRKIYLGTSVSFVHIATTQPVHAQKRKNILDYCIMDAAEAITMVGGYIMMFSVLISIANYYIPDCSMLRYLLPCLEMSNGILMLKNFQLPPAIQYASIVGLATFGGFCSFAQTQSVLKNTSISIFPYIMQKLVTAIVTSLIAYLYFYFL